MENISIPIIHRVSDIYEKNGDLFFITKGDANTNEDAEPVYEKNIQGKVIYSLPGIGWITILIKEIIHKLGLKI